MQIIQVVPRLPPVVDGVGDYALNLAQQLNKDFGITTHFIVCDPTWEGTPTFQGFTVSQVRNQSIGSLISLLPRDNTSAIVLLHYVGYGYAQRGCPNWLIEDLKIWRSSSSLTTLVTMFHEIYAYGRPPWTSAFWLAPIQKNLASILTKISSCVLTSKQLYAKILYDLSLGKHIHIASFPVFSTIGEPSQIKSLTQRKRRLIVFGGRSNRIRVYKQSLKRLRYTCQVLGIEEIWDIGPLTGLDLSKVITLPIIEKGKLTSAEISKILLDSLVGFLDYNPEYLAKSTIFAAYCSHGLLSVSNQFSVLPIDEIESGKHYWFPDEQTMEPKKMEDMQVIANNAYAWYQTHSLPLQTKTFADHLKVS